MHGFEYLKHFLKDEGFVIEQKNGFFFFKFQMRTYVAFENDVPYLQISTICDTSKYETSKLLDVCNTLNDKWYVIKFVVRDPGVWCSYEFIPDNETSTEDYLRIFGLMNKSTEDFYEDLK